MSERSASMSCLVAHPPNVSSDTPATADRITESLIISPSVWFSRLYQAAARPRRNGGDEGRLRHADQGDRQTDEWWVARRCSPLATIRPGSVPTARPGRLPPGDGPHTCSAAAC